jgi:hypothetical protein
MDHGYKNDLIALEWACPDPWGYHSVKTRAQVLGFITLADRMGMRSEAMAMLVQRGKARLAWHTDTQREWQASVSRRPARGRHHDSWSIREKYVRCNFVKAS